MSILRKSLLNQFRAVIDVQVRLAVQVYLRQRALHRTALAHAVGYDGAIGKPGSSVSRLHLCLSVANKKSKQVRVAYPYSFFVVGGRDYHWLWV